MIARIEKALVLLLAASFTLPALVGFWLLFSRSHSRATAWLRNATLSGIQIPPEKVPFSRSALLSARYQSACAASYGVHFAGREFLIRSIDEIYLHAFHVSSSTILVGPNLSLIESVYAQEYCLIRSGKDQFRPIVGDLRRLQDFCDARHIAFALLITPNKAAICPEDLPPNWLKHYQPGTRDYDNFVSLLHEQGIHYVDGHRITADLKLTASVPVFPLGGVHWGDAAALATTNALLELLARQGLKVQPIRNFETHVSNSPEDQDTDLANTVNILFPMHYPVSTLTVPPPVIEEKDRPNMVLVGGSFLWKMMYKLVASRQLSEFDYYGYYKTAKFSGVDGEIHQIAKPAPVIDFDRDIFAADSLVLEINEQTMHDQRHLTNFLHDALAVLPDPLAARVPFHHESWVAYHWGDLLTFKGTDHLVNPMMLRNFSIPGPGSFSEGPLASLEFEAPPPAHDVMMECESGAFVVPKRLMRQTAEVVANGHPLGQWEWSDQFAQHREMRIPKEFLAGGKVKLEFRIGHPASPAEFNLGVDDRKLGVLLYSLRLRELEN